MMQSHSTAPLPLIYYPMWWRVQCKWLVCGKAPSCRIPNGKGGRPTWNREVLEHSKDWQNMWPLQTRSSLVCCYFLDSSIQISNWWQGTESHFNLPSLIWQPCHSVSVYAQWKTITRHEWTLPSCIQLLYLNINHAIPNEKCVVLATKSATRSDPSSIINPMNSLLWSLGRSIHSWDVKAPLSIFLLISQLWHLWIFWCKKCMFSAYFK